MRNGISSGCCLYNLRPPVSGTSRRSVPPLGLAYLAAVLEPWLDVRVLDAIAEGYATEIDGRDDYFAYGPSDAEIRAVLAGYRPDVVGVSSNSSAVWRNAHRMCRLAKDMRPEVVTVMGGPYASCAPEEALANPCVDYVVIGEGEVTLTALLKSLAEGQSLTDVEGLGFRDGERSVVVPRRHYIDDLDALPFPARHLLPMEKYFAINRPQQSLARRTPNTILITSRGCPGRCVFCCVHKIWGRKFRARSSQNVLDELESLVRDCGVREVQFSDDNLTLDRARALAIFEGMIERRLDLAWTAPMGWRSGAWTSSCWLW